MVKKVKEREREDKVRKNSNFSTKKEINTNLPENHQEKKEVSLSFGQNQDLRKNQDQKILLSLIVGSQKQKRL